MIVREFDSFVRLTWSSLVGCPLGHLCVFLDTWRIVIFFLRWRFKSNLAFLVETLELSWVEQLSFEGLSLLAICPQSWLAQSEHTNWVREAFDFTRCETSDYTCSSPLSYLTLVAYSEIFGDSPSGDDVVMMWCGLIWWSCHCLCCPRLHVEALMRCRKHCL